MCYCRRRSPWLFHMNAGSCNGCDIEIVASLTPRYDAEQLGVRLEGSPRHADILCVTGPVTKTPSRPSRLCTGRLRAQGGGRHRLLPGDNQRLHRQPDSGRPAHKHIPVDVFVPGCPPRPDAIILGVAKAAEILAESGNKPADVASKPEVVGDGAVNCACCEDMERGAAMNSDYIAGSPAHLSRPAIRRARRVVLPLGGAQGCGADAGAHRPSFHAAVFRLRQAARQRHASAHRHGRNADEGWPLIAVVRGGRRGGLLPVLPASGGFQGDLILLLALLEVPSMCIIAAGFSSRSIFGEIGSAREAVLSVSYNMVFLLAIVSIAASQHTFRLDALAQLPASPLRWLGILAILVCLPAKLPSESLLAAQRGAGDLLRPDDRIRRPRAGHVGTLAWTGMGCGHRPGGDARSRRISRSGGLLALLFVALSFAIVLLLSVLAAATARLAIDTTVRFYWQCTLIFAVLAISSALFMRFRVMNIFTMLWKNLWGGFADPALSCAARR